jgi:hypothetical protein
MADYTSASAMPGGDEDSQQAGHAHGDAGNREPGAALLVAAGPDLVGMVAYSGMAISLGHR